jgi:pimeloyl-ACP methyl ester carboxylesterase
MKKKKFLKISIGGFTVLAVWIVIAQSCMRFRITDNDAQKQFNEAGVQLTTKTVKIGKRHMHFAKTGSDTLPTIVFVHGSPGSWSAFADHMKDKELLGKYRLISVDRPGFGNSDFGKAMPLREQSGLISQLFSEWKNGKAIYLVGHSLGGSIIIQLFADNPGMIEGLVLLAASVDPAEEKRETWRSMLDGNVLQYLIPGAFRPSNRELLYFKKDIYDLQDKFALVTCKVVIMHGTKDTFVPPGNAAYAAKKLINAAAVETIMLPNADHFILWNNYDEIKTVLMKLY